MEQKGSLLLYSFYWPPSGKASMHWPLHITKHLQTLGWDITVVTVDDDSFSQKDETVVSEIPHNIQVIRTRSFEPFNLYKKFTGKKKNHQLVASETISLENRDISHRIAIWIRMNLFIPDARVGWYPYAVQAGNELILNKTFDVIITIGPPHSTHLAGLKLSSKYNIPHIPVFIDPWVDIIYYRDFNRSLPTKSIDNYLERKVLEHASHSIFVTDTMRDSFIKKYPKIKQNSTVLHWGYEEEKFSKLEKKEIEENVINLLHTGNIFDFQNPIGLWKVLKGLKELKKIHLCFTGTVGPEIKRSIKENDLERNTEYAGFLSYNEMISRFNEADCLLVCVSEPRHVPGKLFEYLRTGLPILAFGNDNVEVASIIRKSNAGEIYSYSEQPLSFFNSLTQYNTDLNAIRLYDRKYIAERFSTILSSVVLNVK